MSLSSDLSVGLRRKERFFRGNEIVSARRRAGLSGGAAGGPQVRPGVWGVRPERGEGCGPVRGSAQA